MLPLPAFDSTLGIYSGQNAGFLGARHDPWFIAGDPNKPDYQGHECLAIPPGLSVELPGIPPGACWERSIGNGKLRYETLDRQDPLAPHQEKAVRIITSGRLANALDLTREPDRVREEATAGICMARRSCWLGDCCKRKCRSCRSTWLNTRCSGTPITKTARRSSVCCLLWTGRWPQLLDDMSASGLLEETLVILKGEFGRTPKIGGFVFMPGEAFTGRDHWLDCFSAVFAGGGVRGGQVIGGTGQVRGTAENEERTSPPTLARYGSTRRLGVDPATEVEDGLGRRVRLNMGERIEAALPDERPLSGGATVDPPLLTPMGSPAILWKSSVVHDGKSTDAQESSARRRRLCDGLTRRGVPARRCGWRSPWPGAGRLVARQETPHDRVPDRGFRPEPRPASSSTSTARPANWKPSTSSPTPRLASAVSWASISTAIPGFRIGRKLLPQTAKVIDRTTVVRSMTHPYPVHGVAYATTGLPDPGGTREVSPRDPAHWPFIGSVVDYVEEGRETRPATPPVPPQHRFCRGAFASTRPTRQSAAPGWPLWRFPWACL